MNAKRNSGDQQAYQDTEDEEAVKNEESREPALIPEGAHLANDNENKDDENPR